MPILFCFFLLFFHSPLQAAQPQHLFYSHGAIVEGDDPRPEHPRHGVYDFPAIVEALQAPGRVVHARHRPAGQSIAEHARVLANEVKVLLDRGVPADNVVLMGFSRGGVITLKASELLQQPRLRLILMASCFPGLGKRNLQPVGRLYSIYETSDGVGGCAPLLQRWPDLQHVDERAIATGLGHGAFYRPRAAWMDIVRGWLDNTGHAQRTDTPPGP